MSRARGSLRWPAQVASAWLGGLVMMLALVESAWREGVGGLLPHAAIVTAGHWTIGLVLLVGALAGPTTVRVLLVASGAVLLAAGVAGLAMAGPVGDALGVSGAVPLPAALLHIGLGVVVAAAAFLPSGT